MQHTIIYDCEFLTNKTALSTFWCGPHDPTPTVVQIGAVKIGLEKGLPIKETKTIYITPKDRHGKPCVLDPFFTELTGITQQDIDDKGINLETALNELDQFSKGSLLWSWGCDERYMVAISTYIHNILPSIPANRFDNAKKLMFKAGMPYEDIIKTNSGRLASYYNLEQASQISEHDGLSDALSITYALQHLESKGRLEAQWLSSPINSL